ncbi:GNAT family protein [uncultured Vagococcus sp.]|uniref:GNAT family N-acetyltransferase n=1 Tax=uncultured Vagococcus sp. TaxID=189676 RepID=UPI0028D8CCEE|nr:GNAT family protein [uncultured Vagococcus sp.]
MIELRPITKSELRDLWKISYRGEHPVWVNYDAPFLHDYHPLSFERFELTESDFFLSPQVNGLYIEGKISGAVNYYWVDEETRWLEVGIAIFEETNWGKGYATAALRLWVDRLFYQEPLIQRIGLTTWSGNPGMAKVANKLNFQLEGRLRGVRYYQGTYYDALHFGCLRSEWSS